MLLSEKMTTLRHQTAFLKPKKYALFFFQLDKSMEPYRTSAILDGLTAEGRIVRLFWDKKKSQLASQNFIPSRYVNVATSYFTFFCPSLDDFYYYYYYYYLHLFLHGSISTT